MLPFDILEYQYRLKETKKRMAESGIEVLLVTDPANINYLSGYNAWSFYVHQMLIVLIDETQPIWIGRYLDASGAKITTWLSEENIISYPDYYVHSTSHHPMDFIAEYLKKFGHGKKTFLPLVLLKFRLCTAFHLGTTIWTSGMTSRSAKSQVIFMVVTRTQQHKLLRKKFVF